MYHSTSSPRTSRSPCEELSGPTRGPSEIGSLHKYTKSHDRLANANKAAAPRTGARGSGADTQELHHARRVAAAERRAFVPTESRAARGGDSVGTNALSRERPAVVEVVAWAASNGDRSENADYLYGKRRLGQIDSRIRFLTKRIDAAVVVDPAAPRPGPAATRVFFGATVTYKDAAGLEHVVSIVGIDEVDLDRGYI